MSELIDEFLGKDRYNSKIMEYKPIKLLGKGAFSKVYLAENFETKELRSIKIIDITNRDEKEIAMFNNEITNLQYLDHQNIVKLDDVFCNIIKHFRTKTRIYIVFFYIDGQTLSQLINTIKPDQHFEIIKQLSYTIHYIHKNNIVHRDIKPHNIIISNTQHGLRPILIDFGLSIKITRNQKFFRGAVGTPLYMAPEQIQNYQQDFKIDIWSLGICFYNIVTNGQHPFCKDQEDADLATIKILNRLGQVNRLWPKIDKNLKDLILQCLNICAANRMDSDQLLCHPYLTQSFECQPKSQARQVRFSVDRIQKPDSDKSEENTKIRQLTPQQAFQIKTIEDSPVTKSRPPMKVESQQQQSKTIEDSPVLKRPIIEKRIQQSPLQSSTPKAFKINGSPLIGSPLINNSPIRQIKTDTSSSPQRNNSQTKPQMKMAGIFNQQKQTAESPQRQIQQSQQQIQSSPLRVSGNIFSLARRLTPTIQNHNLPQLQNQSNKQQDQSPIIQQNRKLPPKAPIKYQTIKQ